MTLQFAGNNWTNPYGIKTRTAGPSDISILVGPSRADAIERPIPTPIVGTEISMTLLYHPSGIPNYDGRYDTIRDMILRADDRVTTGRTIDGTPWFAERQDVTLLSAVKPGEGIPKLEPFWGIITGGTDQSGVPSAGAQIDVDIFVLAKLDDYPSRQTVKENLER